METTTTKIWRLITFKPLELNQSYIAHLNVLVFGINAIIKFSMVWLRFLLFYTHLNLTLMLHKQGFVNSQMATTVSNNIIHVCTLYLIIYLFDRKSYYCYSAVQNVFNTISEVLHK